MSQKDNIFSAKLVKKNGKLVHVVPATQEFQQNFVDSLEEGQHVSVFIEAFNDNGTNAQLAKIHACIRKLATEIGYTFEEMKLEIKRRSGLTHGDLSTSEGYAKSFADCSKEELGLVIESINTAGELVNINFSW